MTLKLLFTEYGFYFEEVYLYISVLYIQSINAVFIFFSGYKRSKLQDEDTVNDDQLLIPASYCCWNYVYALILLLFFVPLIFLLTGISSRGAYIFLFVCTNEMTDFSKISPRF